MTVRDVQAHLEEIYDVEVSPDLISKVTDAVWDELVEWRNRPLDDMYPVVCIDALMIKIRDGMVQNRPAYLAVGVDLDGRKHVLGIWIGDSKGEGSKFWLSVFSELKNRGVNDVLIAVCDGLNGLPDAIEAVWPQATIQTCVVHLICAAMRFVNYTDRKRVAGAIKPIYQAANEDAALGELEAFEAAELGAKYPSAVRTFRDAWVVVAGKGASSTPVEAAARSDAFGWLSWCAPSPSNSTTTYVDAVELNLPDPNPAWVTGPCP